MNKQEFVALLNEKFNGKDYKNYPEYDIATEVNNALGLASVKDYNKVFQGGHSSSSHSTVYLKVAGQSAVTISIHKKKGASHSRWYGNEYCDWTFKEFTEGDIWMDGESLEEARVNALQRVAKEAHAKDVKLQHAREVMDHLAEHYNLTDNQVAELCEYIKNNRYALMDLKDKKAV